MKTQDTQDTLKTHDIHETHDFQDTHHTLETHDTHDTQDTLETYGTDEGKGQHPPSSSKHFNLSTLSAVSEVGDSQSPNRPLQSPNGTYSHPTAPLLFFVKNYIFKVSFASLKSIFLEKGLRESVN